MTATERDASRAARMAQLCDEACELLDSISFDEAVFARSTLHQRALSSILAQIGELAHKLSADYRMSIETDPAYWRGVIGLRNMIAHDYDNVRADILFEVARDEVPSLRAALLSDDGARRRYEELLSSPQSYDYSFADGTFDDTLVDDTAADPFFSYMKPRNGADEARG